MAYDKLKIYRNKSTDQYIVQPMTRHPIGASAEYGTPTIILPDEFESKIVVVTMENLPKYHEQQYNEEAATKYSDQDYERFRREHNAISVKLSADGIIEIVALTGSGGHEGKIYIKREEIGERLLPALREAFRRAADE